MLSDPRDFQQYFEILPIGTESAVPGTCLLVFTCLLSLVLPSQPVLAAPSFLPGLIHLFPTCPSHTWGRDDAAERAEVGVLARQGGGGVQPPSAFPSLLSQMAFQMPDRRFHSPARLPCDGISSSLFTLRGNLLDPPRACSLLWQAHAGRSSAFMEGKPQNLALCGEAGAPWWLGKKQEGTAAFP